MSALADCLAALDAVLTRNGIRWYVFGAQAVAVRGAPRATQDIDVTVELDVDGARALEPDFNAVGLVHRHPALRDELLTDGAVLTMAGPGGMEIDLILAGSGLELLSLDAATHEILDGVSVPVAQATHLVVMKVLAGRGKDLDDVRALLANGEVDVAEAEDLLAQFEAALGQSDLLPALHAAIRDMT